MAQFACGILGNCLMLARREQMDLLLCFLQSNRRVAARSVTPSVKHCAVDAVQRV